MAWITPKHKRGEVDRAGEVLIDEHAAFFERSNALEIVSNWRSSHSFPLNTFQINLRNRAKKVDPEATVAQRLKRLESIMLKLSRFKKMKLSQMHDLGGCRAVLRSTKAIKEVREAYDNSTAKNPSARHEFVKPYDYISSPKPDGYRGVHLVYKYRTENVKHECFNGLRIEVQLRTRLQHAWATAVETVDTFTGQALKSSAGQENWARFFALMGSALAKRERTANVPGTPAEMVDMAAELSSLVEELKIEPLLRGWKTAVQYSAADEKDAVTYLVALDPIARQVKVTGFGRTQLQKATEEYLKLEEQIRDTGIRAVLVGVESLEALRKAYPSYYIDTDAFLNAVNRAIGRDG
jgi:hypothetical protein